MKLWRRTSPWLARIFFKTVLIVVVMVSSWVGSAHAYVATGLYVTFYGNIGSGSTTYTSPDTYKGQTSTSATIYFQDVNIRHFHLGVMEHEQIKEKYNGVQTGVAQYGTGTWGPDISRHRFKATSYHGPNSYFTNASSMSTYYWWACGDETC
jgi:hypothetical protein